MTTARTQSSSAVRGVVLAAAAAVVDWLVKAVATVALEDGAVEIGSLVTLRLSRNAGVAFGLGDWLPGPLLIAVTAALTLALALAMVRGVLGPWWAAGLILGGAFANLVDRAVGGSVVDFVDLGWWPSFNLADVWLTVGGVLLVLASVRTPEPSR